MAMVFSTEPMSAISVEGLGKRIADVWILEALTFEVAAGEVFGLLGPNGAGKTTTLRLLAGLYTPDAGRGSVAGCPLSAGRPSTAALRRKVGLLTEHPGFYDRLPARYNLVHFARLYGLGRHEAERRAAHLIDRLALSAHAEKPFAALSRGMKQKLAIARALVHRPAVVLLDEPTVGLDPEATLEVRRLVGELAADGIAVVLCTHQLAEVERLCSRAAILAGRLIGVHAVDAGATTTTVRIALAGDPPSRFVDPARSIAGALFVTPDVDGLEVAVDEPARVPDLVHALVSHGARISAVVPGRNALEDAYLAHLARARGQGWVA